MRRRTRILLWSELALGTMVWASVALGNGLDGPSITIRADGTPQSYNLSGYNGSSGSSGYPGLVASCGSNDISQSGGNGGNGGAGGDGGNGGDIVAYYTDIASLSKIYVIDTPGSGGSGGAGGIGGIGCNGGGPGGNGANGPDGNPGYYGNIYLIPRTETLPPSVPTAALYMTQMADAPIHLSKNLWLKKTGARALFRAGSDIGNSYYLFRNRVETQVTFRWEATRPLSDFARWPMQVSLDEKGGVTVNFANGLLVDSEIQKDGDKTTYLIKAVMFSAEVANLQLGTLKGNGTNLQVAVIDRAHVSDLIQNEVVLTYYAHANGQYHLAFHAVVPKEALSVRADRLEIWIGKLGIKPSYLEAGTFVYVGLSIKRGFQSSFQNINLGNYFQIAAMSVGDRVEAKQDASLYVGAAVVGHVKKGDKFKVIAIQGPWVSLQKLDGTPVKGWIQMGQVKEASAAK